MRPSRRALVSAAGVIAPTMVAAPPLDAAEILVPGNFATIGEAITASTTGDTILVGPGVYAESIVFSEGAGDGVVLRSTDGPLETTIAYGEVAAVNEAVVAFQRCSSATRIVGFTPISACPFAAAPLGGLWPLYSCLVLDVLPCTTAAKHFARP